ncbi:MAG: 30S ribosomal protein S16 [Candidatus Paceibacterota bacterium]|jgi:small subunit ribosomal protein S16
MLAIRLQRVGKTKHVAYRLIVSEKSRDTQGKYVELLGTYNPHDKVNGFLPKVDRIKYWIGKGATPSPTLNNLFLKNKIIEGKKMKSVFLTKKRSAKIAEKKKGAEAK